MSASVLDDRQWTSSDLRLYPDISPKICLWLSLLHSVCSRDDCPCSSHSCHLGRLVFFSSSRSIHPLPPFDFPMESEGSLLTSATFAGQDLSVPGALCPALISLLHSLVPEAEVTRTVTHSQHDERRSRRYCRVLWLWNSSRETKTWCGTESLKQVLVHCTIYILLYID